MKTARERPEYEVNLIEMRLEDIVGRLNRFKRVDERAFEAVRVVSEFNQRAYELFGRPLVQAFADEYGAKLSREFHPLRFQRWAFSDLNPFLGWLAPTAQAVKAQRQALGPDDPARKVESTVAEITSACLDFGRAVRDTAAEANFFQVYGNLFAFYLGDERDPETAAPAVDARELPFVKSALAAIDQGGYPEALARVAFLMGHKDEPLPLARVQLRQRSAGGLSGPVAGHCRATRRGVSAASRKSSRATNRKRAVETLPVLLAKRKDRDRLLTLLERVLADKRVQRIEPSTEQVAMLARIRRVLGWAGRRPARVPAQRRIVRDVANAAG